MDAPDAPPLPPIDARVYPMYAAADQTLYTLAFEPSFSATVLHDVDVTLDGLAFDGDHLLAIANGTHALLTIDPTTGTIMATHDTDPAGMAWAGMTVIPADQPHPGDPQRVLVGIQHDGMLYELDPATGHVAAVGPFASGLQLYTDMAWVTGVGLFATVEETGSCDHEACLVRIDPTTAAATIVDHDFDDTITGLSGYGGKLRALSSDGHVWDVAPDGALTSVGNPGITWSEAE